MRQERERDEVGESGGLKRQPTQSRMGDQRARGVGGPGVVAYKDRNRSQSDPRWNFEADVGKAELRIGKLKI